MEIVKKDLKIRTANTMLELKKHKDIKEEDIWFYQSDDYVDLNHNDNRIYQVSYFNNWYHLASPPYKPYFMKNPNDNDNLNGVCIYKHGNNKNKTKWIMACFGNGITVPQCKITFQTNENNKITNVDIETKKNKNSKSTYTISLDEAGQVKKITKEGEEEEEEENKDYKDEIKQLLFEDDINKVLIENIEYELDNQQKVVFDTIKKHIGIKIEKDNKKEEEKKGEEGNKEEKKEEEENKDININDKSNNIINNETNNQNQNNNGKSGIANNECSQCLKNIWPFSLCCD